MFKHQHFRCEKSRKEFGGKMTLARTKDRRRSLNPTFKIIWQRRRFAESGFLTKKSQKPPKLQLATKQGDKKAQLPKPLRRCITRK
jgi:hypothetical protein